MRLLPSLAALLLLASACSHDSIEKNENTLIANDFESIEGWASENPSLTKEKAHSGKYSIKTDPNIEYSLTYSNLLGRLSATRLRKVKLKAWVFIPKGSAGVLTLQINKSAQDGTNVFTQGLDVSQETKKRGEWAEVTKVISLPEQVESTNQVRLYLWRASSAGPSYVDDVELTIEP